MSNIKIKEHSPGLCYVATSRTRRLQGVMLQETVDLSRLHRIGGGPVHRQRQADHEHRQPQHLPPPSSQDPDLSAIEPMSSPPTFTTPVRTRLNPGAAGRYRGSFRKDGNLSPSLFVGPFDYNNDEVTPRAE